MIALRGSHGASLASSEAPPAGRGDPAALPAPPGAPAPPRCRSGCRARTRCAGWGRARCRSGQGRGIDADPGWRSRSSRSTSLSRPGSPGRAPRRRASSRGTPSGAGERWRRTSSIAEGKSSGAARRRKSSVRVLEEAQDRVADQVRLSSRWPAARRNWKKSRMSSSVSRSPSTSASTSRVREVLRRRPPARLDQVRQIRLHLFLHHGVLAPRPRRLLAAGSI